MNCLIIIDTSGNTKVTIFELEDLPAADKLKATAWLLHNSWLIISSAQPCHQSKAYLITPTQLFQKLRNAAR